MTETAPETTVAADPRIDLVGLTREELADHMVTLGEKPFRAKQLWHWIYHRGATEFTDMTTLATPPARHAGRVLPHRSPPGGDRAEVHRRHPRKWLFRFGQHHEAETVFIPEDDRGALCISSQVGCTLTCRFLSHRHAAFPCAT